MESQQAVQEHGNMYQYFIRNGVKSRQPKATISKTGRVAFNSACVRLAQTDEIKRVVVCWDTDLPGLRVQAVDGEKHAQGEVIKMHYAGTWVGFAVKEFLMDIGYDLSESRRFPVTYDVEKREFTLPIPLKHLRRKVA